MRKLLALVITALALLSSSATAPVQAQPRQEMRAFWVDALNPGFYNHPQADALVEDVVRANANTIIVQMRRHGDAWYNNSIDPRSGEPRLAPANEFDPLAYLLEKAHSRGIKVHAWLVMSVVCRPSDPLWNHPQHVCTSPGPNIGGSERWTTATFAGRQVGDLDFGHPAAVNYMERVVEQLIRAYPSVDGLHWDYIRYAGPEYGYNQVSLERFRATYGLPANYRPQPTDAAWSQWRRDQVSNLVRRLYIRIKAINPQIQVSAATITWGGLGSYAGDAWENSAAYSRVFQDWRAWLQEGIIDVAIPMHYFDEAVPRSRDWFSGWVTWDRSNTGRRTIAVGLGSWLNSADENIAQINRALETDALGRRLSGVAFFSYAQPVANSTPARRAELFDKLRNSVFAEPAVAPVWPWIAAPTVGYVQGIAPAGSKVTLIHEGTWLRDLSAGPDGWFGAVDIPPGRYTVIVTAPDGSQSSREMSVNAGWVTSM